MENYQVGVFAITDTNEPKVALVTTRSGSRWTFPKGCVEVGRCDRQVAEEEAYEEAGLIGDVQLLYQELRFDRDPLRSPRNCEHFRQLPLPPSSKDQDLPGMD